MWWFLIWLKTYLTVVLLGPERRSRLETLANARVTELAHARKLADALP